MSPILALFALTTGSGHAQSPMVGFRGDGLFKNGYFSTALGACAAVFDSKYPRGYLYPHAQLLKARILLLMNRPREVIRILGELENSEMVGHEDHLSEEERNLIRPALAEAYYRLDDFESAAMFFSGTKSSLLGSFKGVHPNAVSPKDITARIPFLVTDPLPVVSLTANGVRANFIIDTGASDVVLDPDFAVKIGLKPLDGGIGTFAGGKQATQQTGHLKSLKLGTVTVHDLPVHILNTKNFSSETYGKPISGIVGTVLFYHFMTTIDYPGHQLVLAPRKPATLEKSDKYFPFWLASDHLMVAWGKLGTGPDNLFLIDTGLAGAGFTGPKSTTDAAGIAVSMDHAQMGQGGGGATPMAPYDIQLFSMGPVTEKNLVGVYGAFPDSLENSLGFHLSGIISHQFFRPYAVTFDFEKMQVILRKAKPVTTLAERDVVFLSERDMRQSHLNLWFLLRQVVSNFHFHP